MDFDVHQDIHTVKYILYTEYLGGVLSYYICVIETYKIKTFFSSNAINSI